jgi:hypothetical protein
MIRRPLTVLPSPVLMLVVFLVCLSSIASAEWKEKVLYSFQGGTSDGEYPAGGVVFDKAGNLYGATTDGGGECPPAQCGTVFQLAPPAKKGDPWTETVLYIFKGNGSGDGNTPAGSVIIDSAGNLYGTTGYGGTGNCVLLGTKVGCGTVYELSPPTQKGGAWTETVLYSFPTAKQGYLPNGDLVFDSVGNLYGATMFGGGYGTACDPFYQYCGAVFELSPPQKQGGAWTEKVLHGFMGGTDGSNPNGGLVFDSKGAIYGTTYRGGYDCPHNSGQGCGTAFKLTPPIRKGSKWTETVLTVFTEKFPTGGTLLPEWYSTQKETSTEQPRAGAEAIPDRAPSFGSCPTPTASGRRKCYIPSKTTMTEVSLKLAWFSTRVATSTGRRPVAARSETGQCSDCDQRQNALGHLLHSITLQLTPTVLIRPA